MTGAPWYRSNMANGLVATRKVGLPNASISVASGSTRHIARKRSTCAESSLMGESLPLVRDAQSDGGLDARGLGGRDCGRHEGGDQGHDQDHREREPGHL